ncbi:MAG: amidohydrolase family protein, partial [Myxococcales bacterium]|nr:amidohydrolase family protein [Myxococcales bacterium]
MTLAACGAGPAPGEGPADRVLIARRVVTLDPQRPAATALAVRDGRVVWVGEADAAVAHVGPRTQVLHRPDAVVVPGLVDSHAHLMGLGRALSEIDVVGTPSAAAVAAAVAAAPPGPGWILGRGWDQNDWAETAFPTHAPLTAA